MRIRIALGLLLFIFGAISVLVLASIAPQEATGQALFVALGLGAFVGAQLLPHSFWKQIHWVLYILVVFLLVITLVRGKVSKGASRWLPIGPFQVQISELAKPALILTLAVLASTKGLKSQKSLGTHLGLASVPITLVFLQPDLGSALVLFAATGGILLTHVKKLTMLLPWFGAFIVIAFILWEFVLYDYQRARIFSFIGGGQASSAETYNARQSLIAAGSGKILGRGLGRGVQSNLKFLPEFHTDFFFASYAEELGLVGVFFLLVLYAMLFGLLLVGSDRLFELDALYRTGLLYGLAFQTLVHIGMNINLLPVTGIPLPFLSSGGSSFLSLSLALGIAMNLSFGKPTSRRLAEL